MPNDCLLNYTDIEEDMDAHRLVVIPVDRDENLIKRWQVRLITTDIANVLIYPEKRFKDTDGKELEFMNDARPAARFLYCQFTVNIIMTRQRGFAGWERNLQLVTGKPFATWGRWLRSSVPVQLARLGGDMGPEFEAALYDPNAKFPEDADLSEKEENEIGRRIAEAGLQMEDDDDDDDDDDEEEGDES